MYFITLTAFKKLGKNDLKVVLDLAQASLVEDVELVGVMVRMREKVLDLVEYYPHLDSCYAPSIHPARQSLALNHLNDVQKRVDSVSGSV